MKYFRITDLSTEATWYVSSDMPGVTPVQIGILEELDTERCYTVIEVDASEYPKHKGN